MTLTEWKKDFKEYIDMLMLPRDDYMGIMEYIDEVPVADGQWIPCSERLPDESKWYLISNGLDSWVAIWSKENKEWLSVTGLDYTITDVVAWMEFPEPYREGGDNDG